MTKGQTRPITQQAKRLAIKITCRSKPKSPPCDEKTINKRYSRKTNHKRVRRTEKGVKTNREKIAKQKEILKQVLHKQVHTKQEQMNSTSKLIRSLTGDDDATERADTSGCFLVDSEDEMQICQGKQRVEKPTILTKY